MSQRDIWIWRLALVSVLFLLELFLFIHSQPGLRSNKDELPAVAREIIQENSDKYCIFIDLTESMLYLYKDGKAEKKYPVAYGDYDTPSPIGIWKIVYKARNWGSGFGTRWMGIDVPWGIYGIHGTNKPGSIGSSVSKGCIRMFNENVEELYDIVPYNTTVIISGGPYGNLGSDLRELRPGDRNAHVVEVQKRLKKLGYYQGGIDGVYGESMKKSLIKFKRDKKLPITDRVDVETYKALGILLFE